MRDDVDVLAPLGQMPRERVVGDVHAAEGREVARDEQPGRPSHARPVDHRAVQHALEEPELHAHLRWRTARSVNTSASVPTLAAATTVAAQYRSSLMPQQRGISRHCREVSPTSAARIQAEQETAAVEHPRVRLDLCPERASNRGSTGVAEVAAHHAPAREPGAERVFGHRAVVEAGLHLLSRGSW